MERLTYKRYEGSEGPLYLLVGEDGTPFKDEDGQGVFLRSAEDAARVLRLVEDMAQGHAGFFGFDDLPVDDQEPGETEFRK